MKEENKIKSIIAIRAVAVLLVMLCHFFSETALDVHSDQLKEITSTLGHIGVTLFFIVSGFVLPYSMYKVDFEFRTIPRYLFRRAVRIEPPYIASIVLVLICMCAKDLIGQTVNYTSNAEAVFTQLLYLNDILGLPWLNVVYWTLALEFQFYLLIGLLFPLIKKFASSKLSLALLMLCSLKILATDNIWITYYLPFFVIGFSACSFKLNKIKLNQLIILGGCCIVINFYNNNGLYSIMDILTVIIFMVMYGFENKRFSRSLLFIGEISYSIYLIHNIIVAGICILNPLNIGLKWRVVLSAISLVGAVYPSYLFYKFVEKPFHKEAKKIKYRRTHKLKAIGYFKIEN